MTSGRKGWRERIEPGLYRAHRLSCPSSRDRKPGRRCRCPIELKAPGAHVGTTRTLTMAGATIPEARAERRRLLAEGRPPAPVEPVAAPASTLDEFTVAYLRARAPVLSPNTIRNRSDDYRFRIGAQLGHLLLEELTRERVEVWLAELIAASSSRRMVVQTVATLRVILATAVKWERIADNPAARLTLPPVETNAEQAVERVIDRGQLARLVEAAGSPRTQTMIRAAGEAGLRRGEISGLRWPDVDFASRRLRVRRAIVQERPGPGEPMRKVERPTKGRRARAVAISPDFAAALADHYEGVVFSGADAGGYVWPGRDGGPMHNRSLARAVERASARAELLDDEGAPLVSPHGLRHTAASIMLAANVPLPAVSRQLGHANTHVTATIYAHLLGDDQLDLAAAAFTVEETVEETAAET